MILITGATGTIGSHVLSLLTGKGGALRAMTRDPARLEVATAGADNVEVVKADYGNPASLRPAVAGVHTLFLLTVPASPSPDHDIAMLDAARAAGVTRVVRLSAIGTGEADDEGRTIGAWHALAEEAVRTSGLAWTLLRPTTFASNCLGWAGMIRAGEPVANLTGTGAQGIVDPRDVAAVAVETLTSPGHAGRTYTLTGPDLLTVADQADVVAKALGQTVEVVDTPVDAAREQMLAAGMDPSVVDMYATGLAWARSGHNAVVTDDVARILGRPPTSFETWVEQHRSAFTDAG
jgi:uncharacterized protein YbjT (DUF2867 family)